MLQISHTEKPICSARIDQIRLRRATVLPPACQNASSSGFQSEIQLVSRLLIGASHVYSLGRRDRRPAMEAPPLGAASTPIATHQTTHASNLAVAKSVPGIFLW